ncbi:MAG: phosphotransferase family protein [Actinomycetota bacterium]|nr:phosphotransferase family protein [Actinomycetota bacterium]
MTAQPACASAPVRRPVEEADAQILERMLARLPGFAGTAWSVEPLLGGLTNRTYKASPPAAEPVVVRISTGQSELLSIDRVAECHNTRAAARAGAAPAVLACHPHEGVSVVAWVSGRTLCAADLDDSRLLTAIAAMCRALHAGPRFIGEFDMFAIQRRYLGVVGKHGFRLPADYLDFMPAVDQIRQALSRHPNPTVPCHNDLLAANIMDDGSRLWLIDYEYAGNNDPCFELGNLWSESDLDLVALEHLVDSYFGHHCAAQLARARLLALMSKYGWTLWASIQDAMSEVDFDFWGWGMEKYERAQAEFRGPQFARLIEDAQQPNQ